MMDIYDKRVIVPIRVIKGKIEYFYGGGLPNIKDGAIGDLILPEYCIADEEKLQKLTGRYGKKIFEEGEELIIGMSKNLIPPELIKKTLDYNILPPINCRYVKIILRKPLLMQIRGSKKATLSHCECSIPTLNVDAESINHAYTLISQVYEPSRLSHSGNVFERCYYHDKKKTAFGKGTMQWKPLKVIRDTLAAEYEENNLIKKASGDIPDKGQPISKENEADENKGTVGRPLSRIEREIAKISDSELDELFDRVRDEITTEQETRILSKEEVVNGMVSEFGEGIREAAAGLYDLFGGATVKKSSDGSN